MPRRSSEVPEPWVNIKVFSSEERSEILAAGAMIIPVSYRYTHVADCIVDREIGMMICSIQRGMKSEPKVPPVLFGAAGRARPPRILVNLVVSIEQRPFCLGSDKTQLVYTTQQKQWLLPRLVMLLYTTPEESLLGWFDGTTKEPKLPRDPEKALLLDEAMANMPATRFLNGNVHDCRVLNIDSSIRGGTGGSGARNRRSIERREQRQRQLEQLGLVKQSKVISPAEFAALNDDEKLKMLNNLSSNPQAFEDESFHAASDLPALQPIPERAVKKLRTGGVEVLSHEDDQTIDAARVFGELERQKEAEASKGHEHAQIEGQSTSSTRPTDNYQALVNKITDPKTPPST